MVGWFYFCLMVLVARSATRTDTRFSYTSLFRSLAVVDVANHGDDRGARDRVLVVAVVEERVDAEHLLELDLLLLAGVDEADGGADLLGEELDLLIAEGLGGGDHLTELPEEPDDVGRRAVEDRKDVC